LPIAFATVLAGDCTKTGHPVVNGVQRIERKADREEKKRLTWGIGGVDSASFFDTSLFFRLVRRPGLKQGHLQKLCKE
jgi:hypothetical protein